MSVHVRSAHVDQDHDGQAETDLDDEALTGQDERAAAAGDAGTAFSPGARAGECAGDLVFRVGLPLDMERRTGGTGSFQPETQRDLDKDANPLVKEHVSGTRMPGSGVVLDWLTGGLVGAVVRVLSVGTVVADAVAG